MYTGTYGTWTWLSWFVFGICVGIAGMMAFNQIKAKGVLPRWYEWLITAVGVFLFGFAFQNFFGSFAEREPRAAWLSLLFIGFPVVVLGVVLWRSISTRIQPLVKKP